MGFALSDNISIVHNSKPACFKHAPSNTDRISAVGYATIEQITRQKKENSKNLKEVRSKVKPCCNAVPGLQDAATDGDRF